MLIKTVVSTKFNCSLAYGLGVLPRPPRARRRACVLPYVLQQRPNFIACTVQVATEAVVRNGTTIPTEVFSVPAEVALLWLSCWWGVHMGD